MPTLVVAATDFVTSRWDGGSTTQLMIAPKGSSLAARDFDFRISCARVEQSGPFSDFSGYDRLLLILNGQLSLIHNGNTFTLSDESEAWHFAGAERVDATLLSHHVDDFNLFVRPGVMKTAQRLALGAQRGWHQAKQPGAGVYGALLLRGEVQTSEHRLDEHSPLILSSSALAITAETDARFIAFAVGCASPL